MTRDQLRPLENQLVLVSGRLREARRLSDGTVHYLLVAAKVWRWDGESPVDLDRTPDATLDHLWCPVPPEWSQRVNMLSRVLVTGRVSWYRRVDGSTDLAVSLALSMNLDHELQKIRAFCQKGAFAREAAAEFKSMLECMEHPRALPFSRLLTVTEAKKKLRRFHSEMKRSAESQQRIAATSALNRGPCRGAKNFRDLLRA